MPKPLAVLIVEDSESDLKLILRLLKKAGYQVVSEQVETAAQMRAALEKQAWDIVISDYSLPQFDGRAALTLLQEMGLDIPFIVVSGTIGEELAVAMMKAGAQDYLMKGSLTRLAPAIERELAQTEIRRERQQAEEALSASRAMFQQLFESAPDAIVVVAGQGRIARVNSQAEGLFGYARDELLGQPIEQLLPERFHAIHREHRAGYLSAPRVRAMGAGLELLARRKGGSEFPVEVSLSPLEADAGVSVIAVVRDVTGRKRAEAVLVGKNEELRVMTQQLWQAARLATMGELAASIAHELNNPLATVSLRIEGLLSQIPADDPAQRSLKLIEQEAARMSTLVANLLQFSRRGTQQISSLDVRDEIVKTLELIQYQLRQRQIIVAQEFAPDVPLIQADRQQLRQLFLNLFTNASDAMREGGTLTLRVSAAEKEVLIEIADTGVGIAPGDLPRMMEPFYTTKPEGEGTGLGLAICRRIAQEHHGQIDLTSAGPGQGTTVRIALPVKNGSNEIALRRD